MSDLPIECVVWNPDEGTRQDRAYEARREIKSPPEVAARDELTMALRGVEEWRERGLWPPQEAQERLYAARVRAREFGIEESDEHI